MGVLSNPAPLTFHLNFGSARDRNSDRLYRHCIWETDRASRSEGAEGELGEGKANKGMCSSDHYGEQQGLVSLGPPFLNCAACLLGFST